ncbi:cupin domain-containing protein [Nocardia noduli]|uniref:cupin domain-containing protein n=1 Tax=Nocardia noduli TaxID=2815722 RepID=UPI001C222BF4|nr:cupin domain-containing protein [Nocardia noduli]
MSTEPAHYREDPEAELLAPRIVVIGNVSGAPQIPVGAEAMTVMVTLPPGSPGSPPHRHPGPAYGYVLKGEIIFELEGEPRRIVKAGQTFWEPGDVIHYRDGNNLDDAESVFLVTMFCPPGYPILEPVGAEELARRRDR